MSQCHNRESIDLGLDAEFFAFAMELVCVEGLMVTKDFGTQYVVHTQYLVQLYFHFAFRAARTK